ncbi:MAG: transcriptional regulator, partial [Deltaproteobacteria bacterium]|nr:transcriptional regulator [Deltaproteobacteria bacterium]
MTCRDLAESAGLSLRFLTQVEAGTGNIAVTRLARLAHALDVRLADLVADPAVDSSAHRTVIVLLGLRGAGKSSLGRAVAQSLNIGFQEHDRLVEEAAGMDLKELFPLHGDAYYRRLAR